MHLVPELSILKLESYKEEQFIKIYNPVLNSNRPSNFELFSKILIQNNILEFLIQ